MARKYRSPRRESSKAETIREILAAAIKLHGQGVTDLPSVAREAGVSLATVTKYFPTREELFVGCTGHFAELHPLPSPAVWGLIGDPEERLSRVVSDLYALHETAFGQVWTAYRLAGESQVMAGMVRSIEGFCREAARIIVGNAAPEGQRAEAVAFVAGMLSPLTYRSLRLVSSLSPENALRWALRTIRPMLG